MDKKNLVNLEMKRFASRRPGNRRLVLRKETKTIWEVDSRGEFVRDTGIKVQEG